MNPIILTLAIIVAVIAFYALVIRSFAFLSTGRDRGDAVADAHFQAKRRAAAEAAPALADAA